MRPAVARRLLYGIVAVCLGVTGGTALLRPAPARVTEPRNPVAIDRGLPVVIHEISGAPRFVTVPIDGGTSQSVHLEIVVPVHGLAGQVGASP
jgi:hypothetical protein